MNSASNSNGEAGTASSSEGRTSTQVRPSSGVHFALNPDEELQMSGYKYHHDFPAKAGRRLRLAIKSYPVDNGCPTVYIHLVVFKYNYQQYTWLRRSHLALTLNEFMSVDGFIRQPPPEFQNTLDTLAGQRTVNGVIEQAVANMEPLRVNTTHNIM